MTARQFLWFNRVLNACVVALLAWTCVMIIAHYLEHKAGKNQCQPKPCQCNHAP